MIIIKRHGNLWEKIIDKNNILLAIAKSSRRKGRISESKKKMIQRIKDNPEEYADRLRNMFVSGTYKTSNYYIYPLFDPKLRFIYCLPFFPDRVAHHVLLNVLEPIWDNLMISGSYACRTGFGQHKAGIKTMQYVKKYKYCLQCDVAQFYISLNHDILKKVIRKKLKDVKVLEVLDGIIDSISTRKINLRLLKRMEKSGSKCTDVPKEIAKLKRYTDLCGDEEAGVPIGNYTSQWLGNLYLNELDMFIKHKLQAKAYGRYCDDFILYSNNKAQLHEWRKQIEAFLWDELKLMLSKSNVFCTSQGVDFLGYRYFPSGYILLRKRTAKVTRKRLKKIESDLNVANIDVKRLRSQVASANGYMKWATSKHFRDSINYDEIAKKVSELEEV